MGHVFHGTQFETGQDDFLHFAVHFPDAVHFLGYAELAPLQGVQHLIEFLQRNIH